MKTKVLFLIDKDTENEVFAYFKDIAENQWRDYKSSYSHVGQHSPCHPNYANECTKASPAQYAALQQELKGIGYDLEIIEP